MGVPEGVRTADLENWAATMSTGGKRPNNGMAKGHRDWGLSCFQYDLKWRKIVVL